MKLGKRLYKHLSAIFQSPDEQLFPAIRDGKVDVLLKLLKAGASPNYRSAKGQTPLMHAAALDQTEIVRILLVAGALPETSDQLGETALQIAAGLAGVETLLQLLETSSEKLGLPAQKAAENRRQENFMRLVEAGLNLHTFIENAVRNGNVDVLTSLISWNIPLQQKNQTGDNLVMIAVKVGRVAMVRKLLDAGVQLNQGNHAGETPLLVAVERNDVLMVGYLIEQGAYVNLADKTGRLPIMVAQANKEFKIVSMLRKGKIHVAPRPEKKVEVTEENKNDDQYWINHLQNAGERTDDPLQIFGIDSVPQMGELRKIYYQRMKEFHPDRFMRAPEWVRTEVEEWAKAVNLAYEKLKRA
jgi:ankyrin repeat protein